MNREIELKLDMPPEGLARLAADPLVEALAVGPAETVRLRSVYFDTPDAELAAHGVALRIRRDGARRILTVKTAPACGAPQVRGEWEKEVAGDVPEDLPAAAAPGVLDRPGLASRLEAVFETDFERTRRMLVLPGGTEVELAVDRGEVRSNGRSAPIAEAELELKSGRSAELFALARRLHQMHPFHLGHTTKAERGYALRGAAPSRPERPDPPVLEPSQTVEDAFRRIAASCLAHLRRNEACALGGEDPAGVHQMRVASRRLRSAIGLFAPVLPPDWTDAIAGELRRVAGELADAREWDVFLTETLAPLEETLPGDPSLALLRERAAAARDEAYARVRATVEDPRYTAMLLDVGQWLGADSWSVEGGEEPVGEFAARALGERARRVRKRGRGLRGLSAPQLHKLRIRVKRLRYAWEFFESLEGSGRSRRMQKALRRLQDLLGHLQDVEGTQARLALLDAPDAALLEHARGVVAGWQAAARKKTRARLRKAWAAYRKLR